MNKLYLLLIALMIPILTKAQNTDFGDAPDNAKWWGGTGHFPTLNASTGPKHLNAKNSSFWIGDKNTMGTNSTSIEPEAKVSNMDEDDGRPMIFIRLIGLPAPSDITVPISTNSSHNPGTDIYVNVAIDVDNDMDFNDTPDKNWVVENQVVRCPADTSMGFNFGPFNFGNDLSLLPCWVRVTVTDEPVQSPWNGLGTGSGWTNGETEDWFFGNKSSMGHNARIGQGPLPVGLPVDSIPQLQPQLGTDPEYCVDLIYPHTVYLHCEQQECLRIGVKDCGQIPVSNISLAFVLEDGQPMMTAPAISGNPVKIGNIVWYNICATGWPCESETGRFARFKVQVTYNTDDFFVMKEFILEYANDEVPTCINENGNNEDRVAAEAMDSTGLAPWYVNQAQQLSKKLVAWEGHYPGEGNKWLANGQPQMIPKQLPSWLNFNEIDRTEDNTSATYSLTGTPPTSVNGLVNLVFEVTSSDESDGFVPWDWIIPVYINHINNNPEITETLDEDYNINTAANTEFTGIIKANDDDYSLSKRDTTFFDYYLWDTDSSKYYDADINFTKKWKSADFSWTPERKDVGNYDLIAQTWDYYGAKDSSISELLIYYMQPDFEAHYPVGFAPATMTFTDKSVVENANISSRDWFFGDSQTSTQLNPVHTYNNSGTYTVRLKTTNSFGFLAIDKAAFVIVNKLDFTVDTTEGKVPFEAHFRNLSGTELPISITSNTGISAVFKWSWDFGDDLTGTDKDPSHYYETPGVYPVSLQGYILIYDKSVSETEPVDTIKSITLKKDDYIIVTGDLIADFEADTLQGNAPLKVKFTDKSLGDPETWLWTFGDGGESTQQHPEHTYTSPGDYTVSLTVFKGSAKNLKKLTNFIKVNEDLDARFSADKLTGDAPLTVKFKDESVGDPLPLSWIWDFGDGASSTEQNPEHLYNLTGNYDVSLVVNNGVKLDTTTKKSYIKVGGPGFTADFSADPISGDAPLIVQFTDLSIGEPTNYNWDFGDAAGTSTDKNPVYTYNNSGTYTVSLTITSGDMSDTETKEHYISVGPVAVYDYMANSFDLYANYPNPITDITTISYNIEYDCNITLKIFNILGEEIKIFENSAHKFPGNYSVVWDLKDINGRALPSGIYYYELRIEGSKYSFSKVKEMILLK